MKLHQKTADEVRALDGTNVSSGDILPIGVPVPEEHTDWGATGGGISNTGDGELSDSSNGWNGQGYITTPIPILAYPGMGLKFTLLRPNVYAWDMWIMSKNETYPANRYAQIGQRMPNSGQATLNEKVDGVNSSGLPLYSHSGGGTIYTMLINDDLQVEYYIGATHKLTSEGSWYPGEELQIVIQVADAGAHMNLTTVCSLLVPRDFTALEMPGFKTALLDSGTAPADHPHIAELTAQNARDLLLDVEASVVVPSDSEETLALASTFDYTEGYTSSANIWYVGNGQWHKSDAGTQSAMLSTPIVNKEGAGITGAAGNNLSLPGVAYSLYITTANSGSATAGASYANILLYGSGAIVLYDYCDGNNNGSQQPSNTQQGSLIKLVLDSQRRVQLYENTTLLATTPTALPDDAEFYGWIQIQGANAHWLNSVYAITDVLTPHTHDTTWSVVDGEVEATAVSTDLDHTHTPALKAAGGGSAEVLHNLTDTTDPTTEGTSEGYTENRSLWMNTVSSEVFRFIDDTYGWVQGPSYDIDDLTDAIGIQQLTAGVNASLVRADSSLQLQTHLSLLFG